MKTLVTGGAGFIGSHVVDHLLAAGHEVTIVDNFVTGRRENLNPKAALREVDIRDEALGDVLAEVKPGVVFHLAAQMNVTLSVTDPKFDADCNVLGIINLLEGCVKHGVKRIVFSSTGGAIYGEPKDLPADESTIPAPMSPYAVSKFAGEEYIKYYNRMHGLEYVVLRYTNVFGPRQVSHGECGVCAILTELMLDGKQPTLFGFGEPVRDYVYVGDVARANVIALEKGANTTVNICSGKPTSVMQIFDALKNALNYTQEPILKPLRAGEVEKIFCTNDLAKEKLGWSPEVDLATGLQATVDHIKG